MENLKEIKKKVAIDWTSAFPDLSVYTQNKFYKITGPVVIGIEAVNIPAIDGYRPHFVVYPLWKADVKMCLDAPLVYKYISDKKGFQFDIPYVRHSDLFSDALYSAKKQIPISIDKDVTLRSLFDMVNVSLNDIIVRSNVAQQAKLYEFKLYLARYTDNQDEVKDVLNQIQKERKKWDTRIFELWFGKYDTWFECLQKNISDWQGMLAQIATNKKDKKIANLKSSEVI